MILLIDNYDSFSYNLYQLIGSVEPDIRVVRNDECTLEEIWAMKPEAIILCVHAGCPGSPFSRAMSTGTNDYDCYITRWHISQLLVPIFLFSFYTDSDIGILQSTS